MAHAPYTVGTVLPSHTLIAHNDASASENKIHDDTVAAQYGFRGGLVPGVSVYAYMTYPLVESFGADWLARGTAQVKLAKPFYDNDEVTVHGTVSAVSDTALEVDIRGTNAEGLDCGIGTATLPASAAAVPDIAAVPAGAPAKRIPVSWDVVQVGEPLPVLYTTMSQEDNEAYSREHSDDLPMYQGPHAYVHPGWLLRRCNQIFSDRFLLGPWIHVASDIATYRPCRVGEPLEIRGVPIDKFEKKGHEFVALDILIIAAGEVAQRITHTAIFRPRQAHATA